MDTKMVELFENKVKIISCPIVNNYVPYIQACPDGQKWFFMGGADFPTRIQSIIWIEKRFTKNRRNQSRPLLLFDS